MSEPERPSQFRGRRINFARPLRRHQSSSRGVTEWSFVGLFQNASYSVVGVRVEPCDKTILYTDGILETRSPPKEELGPDLFKVFLESNHNLKAGKFADSRINELGGWSENRRGLRTGWHSLMVIDF